MLGIVCVDEHILRKYFLGCSGPLTNIIRICVKLIKFVLINRNKSNLGDMFSYVEEKCLWTWTGVHPNINDLTKCHFIS